MKASNLLLILALGLATRPAVAEAQDWRTMTTLRQFNGENALQVDVEYGAGRLRISPADDRSLYRATLRYDADNFQPVSSYENGRLRIGVDGGTIRGRNNRPGQLDLALGTLVPLDLALKFGAGTADVELGGLRVRSTEVQTGASETRIRVSTPNPVRCTSARFEIGAAQFRVEGLANLNCERILVSGGVGEVTLDFTDELRASSSIGVEMGLGSLILRVPRGTAVSVRKKGVLSSFDSQGLIKRGDVYYSENFEQAEHRLTFDIDAALGSIRIQWVN